MRQHMGYAGNGRCGGGLVGADGQQLVTKACMDQTFGAKQFDGLDLYRP